MTIVWCVWIFFPPYCFIDKIEAAHNKATLWLLIVGKPSDSAVCCIYWIIQINSLCAPSETCWSLHIHNCGIANNLQRFACSSWAIFSMEFYSLGSYWKGREYFIHFAFDMNCHIIHGILLHVFFLFIFFFIEIS